jgi:large subunit ribosomal protein L17
MRHRKKTIKLGRTSAHRDALLSSLVCNLIIAKRITTTLQKAKAARSLAERMVTLAKRNTLATRRRASSILHQEDVVATLFTSVGPAFADRAGGYTRIMKLGTRGSDSSEMVLLEWVNFVPQPPKKKVAKKGEKDAKPESGTKEAAAAK